MLRKRFQDLLLPGTTAPSFDCSFDVLPIGRSFSSAGLMEQQNRWQSRSTSNLGFVSAALLLEILHQEPHHVVAIHVFERRFASGVMAARQDYGFQIGAIFAKPCFSFTGELRQEREIVTRVDQEILLWVARELIEVRHGTHALP